MVTRAYGRSRSGFTLTELVVVIAIVGILAGIMIPRLIGADKAASVASAVNLNRELQTVAEDYYAYNMVPPTIVDLQNGYNRNGGTKINEKFVIFSVQPGTTDGNPPTKSGGVPSPDNGATRYVICSIMEIKGASYVFSLDDNPPMVAYEDEDPVGGGICGPGKGPGDSTPTGDDDDDGPGATDDDGPGATDDDGPGATDDDGPGATDDDGPGATDDDGPGATDDDAADDDTASTDDDDDTPTSDDDDAPTSDDDDAPTSDDDASDDDTVEDVDPMGQIEAQCPCDGDWKNHGEYVSCAEKAINNLRKAGKISKSEKADLKKAVNDSDCGESGHECSHGHGHGDDDDDDDNCSHGHGDDDGHHGGDDDHQCSRGFGGGDQCSRDDEDDRHGGSDHHECRR